MKELLTVLMVNRAQVTLFNKLDKLPTFSDCNKDFFPSLALDCAGFPNGNEKWMGNEAHGGLFGVYMNKDGLPGCSQIRGFLIWKSFDHGIYFQVSNIYVLNCILSAEK